MAYKELHIHDMSVKIYTGMTNICNLGFSKFQVHVFNSWQFFSVLKVSPCPNAKTHSSWNLVLFPTFTSTVNDTMIRIVVQERNPEISLSSSWSSITKSWCFHLPVITHIHLLSSMPTNLNYLLYFKLAPSLTRMTVFIYWKVYSYSFQSFPLCPPPCSQNDFYKLKHHTTTTTTPFHITCPI